MYTSAKKAFKTGQKRHHKTGPATGLVATGIKSLHLRPTQLLRPNKNKYGLKLSASKTD